MSEKNKNALRVTVQVGDTKFDEDLAQQAFIEPSSYEALNRSIELNPGLFAKWAMLEARARAQYDGIQSQLEAFDSDLKTLDAELYLLVKADGGLTVDGIKATVQTHPRRKAKMAERAVLTEQYLAAKDALESMIVGRKTIEQKRDSLLALASNWRQEISSRLQVGDSRLLDRARQARDKQGR